MAMNDIADVMNKTDWYLLKEQKLEIVKFLDTRVITPGLYEALDGILNWIDAIQDANEGRFL